jgi:hypothetical protein
MASVNLPIQGRLYLVSPPVPTTWTFDPAHDVNILTVTAPHTFDDCRRVIDAILAARPGAARLLLDRRGAGPMTTNLVDDMVGYFRARADRLSGSIAAIVVGGDAAFGMARMLEIRAEVSRVPMPMKIFLEYDDALRWLSSIDTV